MVFAQKEEVAPGNGAKLVALDPCGVLGVKKKGSHLMVLIQNFQNQASRSLENDFVCLLEVF